LVSGNANTGNVLKIEALSANLRLPRGRRSLFVIEWDEGRILKCLAASGRQPDLGS